MTKRADYQWCPACGCEVRDRLTTTQHAEAIRLHAKQKQLDKAVNYMRCLVVAMERHAKKQADVQRSVPEIYRLWSTELFKELAKYFPDALPAHPQQEPK